MINIHLDKPDKFKNNVLIKYCAFIKFSYNVDIVNIVRALPYRVYDKETKTWEVPINYLAKFCNECNTETIKISGEYHSISAPISESVIPDDFKFKTKPFKHQIEGVNFGLKQHKFLLADEQGLGKSKTIIDLVSCLSQQNKVNKALIICGVNSLKYNWLQEIKTHSNDKGYVLGTRIRKRIGKEYEGSFKDKLDDLDNLPQDYKYIITNVESLRAGAEKIGKSKYKFPIAEKLKELCDNGTIDFVAFDEIHKNKNPTSMQGRATSIISAKYMVAMSGTPLMNNPLDLYYPIKWLGYEPHSYYMFKQHYCIFGGFGGSQVVGFKKMEELKDMLNEIMLRRLKTEVLDLPPKIKKIEYVDMTNKQESIYKEAQEGIMKNLNKIKFSNNPMAMLIRLRQATGYTGILSDTIKESAKLNRLEDIVDELASNNKKCIVFSNWSSITKVAKERLSKYNPAYITGETDTEARLKEVNKFQSEDNCKVIIGTIGAMGTGLTLTAATTVIFLDSPWNRALKEQAEDRAYRIGTKGTVNIITICCKDTIDEKIEKLIELKGQLSDAVVDDKLSFSDIEFLIS